MYIPDQIQACLATLIDRGVPGLSATILTPSQTYSTSLGVSTISPPIPLAGNNTDTYGIGSITKVFLSVVILQLIDEDLLSLESKVSDLLERSIWDGIPNAGEASIGMLMSHMSGIPSWEDDPSWIRIGRGADIDVHKIWSETEPLDFIRYESMSLSSPNLSSP
jgi:D-alanyl-D-alanine carboxypeptidase